jgi:hypothetical protein
MRDHRCAPILVYGQLVRRDMVTRSRFVKELLCQCAVLLSRDHPCHHKPTEEVEHNVEREVLSTAPGGQFTHVPRPHFVGLGSPQARNGMMLGWTLWSSIAFFTSRPQQAMHSTQ